MNLYNLHKDPKSLHKHKEAHDTRIELISDRIDNQQKLNANQIKVIGSDYSALCYKYAHWVLEGKFPGGEKAISTNSSSSLAYAENVLKGRFRAGEQAIIDSRGPNDALNYAIRVIKGPWPEAEDTFASTGMLAYRYAANVLKGRFPKGEKEIAKHAGLVVSYAMVIKNRFPAGEKILRSSGTPGHIRQYNEVLTQAGFSDDYLITH